MHPWPGLNWNDYSAWVIRRELKKRGLIPSGPKGRIVQRLQDAIAKETFHPFKKLPAELRRKIWEMAMPEQRRVVRFERLDHLLPAGFILTPQVVPVAIRSLMFACKESSQEVLARYQPGYKQGTRSPPVSFADDVFVFKSLYDLEQRSIIHHYVKIHPHCEHIKTLILHYGMFKYMVKPSVNHFIVDHSEAQKRYLTYFNSFTALEEIVIYCPYKDDEIIGSASEEDKWGISKSDKPSKLELLGLNWINLDDCEGESDLEDDTEAKQYLSEVKKVIEADPDLATLKKVKFVFFRG